MRQTRLHTSAPTRSGWLGRGKCSEGLGLAGITAFSHTACSGDTARWHFHKMAPLNYAGQWIGKTGTSGVSKAYFLGVCLWPQTASCFLSARFFHCLCKTARKVMGEQSSQHATSVTLFYSRHIPFFSPPSGLERHSVTSRLAPILSKLIPIWPSSVRLSKEADGK